MTQGRKDDLISSYLRKIWRYGRRRLFGIRPQEKRGWGAISLPELPKASVWTAEKIQSRDWHLPLNTPIWRSAADATHMRSDDPVLGIVLGGQAWALPWWVLKNHHVANLQLDGQPVMVGLCEMCSSGAAFHAVVDDRRLTFGQSGIHNGSIMLSDAETGGYWAPWSGEALSGPYKGRQLERLPLYLSSWHDWLSEHPASQVLYAEQSAREGHGSAFSPGSPGIGPVFRGTLLRPLDERLPHNTLVLGITHQGASTAYPLQALHKRGAVTNDVLGGEPVVVLHKVGTYQALAFSAQLHGDVLTFHQDQHGDVLDHATGSRWTVTGLATSGQLCGAQLAYIPSGVEEWYVWAAYHPETMIVDADDISWESAVRPDIEEDHDHH